MIPIKRAIFLIFLSTFLISGTAFFALFYYKHYLDQRKQDPRYMIKGIVQEKIEGPFLSNGYLTELLDLSSDRPINLYHLRADEAERRLLASPHIKSVQVKKINPSILYISYSARTPLAAIGNVLNQGIDDEGAVFPIRPFIEENPLPILFLNEVKKGPELELGLKILKELKGYPIQQVDVSQAFALSSGKRQIIIEYDGDLLRLNKEEYLTQIKAYIMLRGRFDCSKVVDLRIPRLAYIKNKE